MTMSLITSFLTIVGIWLLTVITPGPNLFATITASTINSRRAGIALSLGIAFGTTIWCIISFLGLGLFLKTGSLSYEILKMIGGIYLIFLGIKSIASNKRNILPEAPSINVEKNNTTLIKAFIKGMLVDLSNPKAAIFFTSLFAIAIPSEAPIWFKLLILISVVSIAGVWYSIVAKMITTKPTVFVKKGIRKIISHLSGTLFIGLGAYLIFEDN